MNKINPDDNSNCIRNYFEKNGIRNKADLENKIEKINPDEEPLDQEQKQDKTFLTFEEIKARRQTAQSKYQQKKYFVAVFGDKN